MGALSDSDWFALGQTERNAAYDNAAATIGRDAIVAKRDADAMAYRAANPEHLDIAYGPRQRNKWDLYPASEPGAPCMVFIHGGYWQYNSRENFAAVAKGARAHGWSVAMPGYSLAPEVTLSEIIAEIHRALDWLAFNGADHGIAGKIALTGWSAGGHLAAAALDHPSVEAGMAVSGIYDVERLRTTYVNDLLKLSDEDIFNGSPMRQEPSPKKLIVAYGDKELPEMQRQSVDFHAYRTTHHCPGELIPAQGADHFSILARLQEPDGLLLAALLKSIQAT